MPLPALTNRAAPPSIARSEVRANTSYGLLMLTLREGSYDWRFVPAAEGTPTDAGTGQCR